VTPGCLLMGAVLLYLDETLFWPGLLACALHECGHLVGIWLAGGRVRCLRLAAMGAEMGLDPTLPLSYGGELQATMAGPAVSLLAAAVGGCVGWYLFAGISLALGIFNLLPIRSLDGGRSLYFLTAMLVSQEFALKLLSWCSSILSAALMGGGSILVMKYGNPTLLFTAICLMVETIRQEEKNPCTI
jgi:stage IV sporulation protein FB